MQLTDVSALLKAIVRRRILNLASCSLHYIKKGTPVVEEDKKTKMFPYCS